MTHENDALTRPSLLSTFPEIVVAVTTFCLHFVWEFVQAPTYSGMVEMNHWDGIKLCMSATFGDVGFALTAFWLTALAARSRNWMMRPTPLNYVLFLAVGLALTVGFEYYYTQISLRWTYSDLMPLVPPFGTGLSPLLQWVFIPLLTVWTSRRIILGSLAIQTEKASSF